MKEGVNSTGTGSPPFASAAVDGRAGLRLADVDGPFPATPPGARLRRPVVSPPPPQGISTASMSASCSVKLEPDRPVAGHDHVVADRVDEQPLDVVGERLLAGLDGGPPVRPTAPARCVHPCVRRRRASRATRCRGRRSSPARGARGPSRRPLRHVPGARRHDPLRRAPIAAPSRMALAAPRSLNEPIGWRFSSLSQISARRLLDVEPHERRPHCGRPRSARARARSPPAESEVDLRPDASLAGAGDDELRTREVLDGDPQRFEDGELVLVGSAGVEAGKHLAELGLDVVGVDGALELRRGRSRRPRSAPTRGGRRRTPTRRPWRCRARARSGWHAPTAFTCAPVASHRRSTTGSVAEGRRAHDLGAEDRRVGRRRGDRLQLRRERAPPRRCCAPRSGSRDRPAPRASRGRARAPAPRLRGSRRARRPCGRALVWRRRRQRRSGSRSPARR